VTRDSVTAFKVKMSKVSLQGARAYCGGLPHNLIDDRSAQEILLLSMIFR